MEGRGTMSFADGEKFWFNDLFYIRYEGEFK
jgi:hypothetical protein